MRSPNALLVAAADHERADLARLRSLLSPHIPLTCVRDGTELNEALRRGPYDVLFYLRPSGPVDWKSRLSKMRARYPDLPVIVLTSTDALGEFAEALDAGVFDFLVPPYGRHDLLAVVAHAVASTEARAWRTVSS